MSGSPTFGNFASGALRQSANATAAFLELVDCQSAGTDTVKRLKGVDAGRLLKAQVKVSEQYGTT